MDFLKMTGMIDSETNCIQFDEDKLSEMQQHIKTMGNVPQLLKDVVKSQIYRPLFFNPEDHATFTSNPDMYRCSTSKFFQDHTGEERELMFGEDGSVDLNGSGLSNYDDVKYHIVSNILEYTIKWSPIPVDKNKSFFVYNDVQYYVTWTDGVKPH